MSTTTSGATGAPADEAITPFTLAVSDADLADLRDRLARTRWPAPLPGEPWARGIPVDVTRGLAEYWRDGFDWRAAEAGFNALPQFTTTIDGTTVYFIHQRSTHEGALPLLLCHGWPGSVAEFLHVIEPLTQPERHGGDPADAFHVVIPAMPGFPLSGPQPDEGWTEDRIAATFVTLMARLGYDRYGVQGGDFGAGVCPAMGRQAPDRIVGVHVNAASQGFIPWGTPPEEELATFTDLERERLGRLGAWLAAESGYFTIQGTKPETLSYGLTDSPAGQLAWIAEKFHGWTDPARGLEEAVDRDHLLTNVSLYWFTATAGSSANLYHAGSSAGWGDEGGDGTEWSGDASAEGDGAGWSASAGDGDGSAWSAAGDGDAATGVPTGVAVFHNDVAIRRYGEQSNNITHWTDFDTGGHFAAMETPDLLVGDVRAFFRTVR